MGHAGNGCSIRIVRPPRGSDHWEEHSFLLLLQVLIVLLGRPPHFFSPVVSFRHSDSWFGIPWPTGLAHVKNHLPEAPGTQHTALKSFYQLTAASDAKLCSFGIALVSLPKPLPSHPLRLPPRDEPLGQTISRPISRGHPEGALLPMVQVCRRGQTGAET